MPQKDVRIAQLVALIRAAGDRADADRHCDDELHEEAIPQRRHLWQTNAIFAGEMVAQN